MNDVFKTWTGEWGSRDNFICKGDQSSDDIFKAESVVPGMHKSINKVLKANCSWLVIGLVTGRDFTA